MSKTILLTIQPLLSLLLLFTTLNLGAQDCNQQGTIFFAPCNGGTEYFFIEKSDGEIIDPYYGPGVFFNHFDGQVVNFSISNTFDSPCSIAASAVTVDCIEDAGVTEFDWLIQFPFLDGLINPPCANVNIEAYPGINGIWLFVNTPQNGAQLYFEDGTLYCSGADCLSQFGIVGNPVDVYNCGDPLGCPDPGNCNDGNCSNGEEVWSSLWCDCITVYDQSECDVLGALNYNPNATCAFIQSCEFTEAFDGMTICAGESVLIGTYPLTDVATPGCPPHSSIIPSANTQTLYGIGTMPPTIANTVGFLVTPTETTTYTFTDHPGCFGNISGSFTIYVGCNTGPVPIEVTACAGEQIFLPGVGPMNGPIFTCPVVGQTISSVPGISSPSNLEGFYVTLTESASVTVTTFFQSGIDFPCPSAGQDLVYNVTVEDCPPPNAIDIITCAGEEIFLSAPIIPAGAVGSGCPAVDSAGQLSPFSSGAQAGTSGWFISPTESDVYTITVFSSAGFPGSDCPSSAQSIFNVIVEECQTPNEPIDITTCSGEQVFLAAPFVAAGPVGSNCAMFGPGLLVPSLSGSEPSVEGWYIYPTESETYTIYINSGPQPGGFDCPSGEQTYNVIVEDCPTTPVVDHPNGFDGMTICAGETVQLFGGCANDIPSPCPSGPAGGIWPGAQSSFFDGFCTQYVVQPFGTTTFLVTYTQDPCLGPITIEYTINVDDCGPTPIEITACAGDQVFLEGAGPIIGPDIICNVDTPQISPFVSGSQPTSTGWFVYPTQSGSFTLTSNIITGPGIPCGPGSVDVVYNITIENCNPPESACYNESIVYANAECDAYGYDPVCSCDNVTYNNICEAYYLNGITTYYVGACVGDPINPPIDPPVDPGCIDQNLITSVDCDVYAYDPVCGCDGVTYSNSCEAYWVNGVTSYTAGACSGTPIDPPADPGCYDANVLYNTDCADYSFDPVCGCDNQTYANICEAFYQNGITSYSVGACPDEMTVPVNLFDEKGVPFIICHDGFNRNGKEVISGSAKGLECGRIHFLDQNCFQYLPDTECDEELVAISWIDQEGLTETQSYLIKINDAELSLNVPDPIIEDSRIRTLYGDGGEIWVEIEDLKYQESTSYQVFDMSGRIAQSGQSVDSRWKLETSNLPKGIYVISTNFGSTRFIIR